MILPLFLDMIDQRLFPEEARVAIQQICDATEPEVRVLLPTLESTIALEVFVGASVIPETGEVGAAVAPDRVSWTADARRTEGVAGIAQAQLRFTLFHELHHCARGWVKNGGKPRTSFMDGVVSEGLATAFERDAAGRVPPWGEYPRDVRAWVAELLDLPLAAPYGEWMFRYSDGRRWIGYRAGTYIADQAIAASGQSAAQLFHVPTYDILKMAGFAREAR